MSIIILSQFNGILWNASSSLAMHCTALHFVFNLVFNQKNYPALSFRSNHLLKYNINIFRESQMIDALINEILALYGNRRKRMMMTENKKNVKTMDWRTCNAITRGVERYATFAFVSKHIVYLFVYQFSCEFCRLWETAMHAHKTLRVLLLMCKHTFSETQNLNNNNCAVVILFEHSYK